MRGKIVFFLLVLFACCSEAAGQVMSGACNVTEWKQLLQHKRFALLTNNASMVGNRSLLDTMLLSGCTPQRIFAPEHGFTRKAEAGEKVANDVLGLQQIPIISLYGNKTKPAPSEMQNLDFVVFDIQDVGVRFYTYLSSLYNMMEACARSNVTLLLLDRPNPNGHYIDGPVLQKGFESFVGIVPVPVVHGMTLGEMAGMINGEYWLPDGIQCKLEVIKCSGYNHKSIFYPPVPPSPNLKSPASILLYPSLCFFEGTPFSVGRGTETPFELFGHPNMQGGDTTFTPAKSEREISFPHEGIECRGWYVGNKINPDAPIQKLQLFWLIRAYRSFPEKERFFLAFFDKLAGTDQLRKQIESGMEEAMIRKAWQPDLIAFKTKRKKYLLYQDFE